MYKITHYNKKEWANEPANVVLLGCIFLPSLSAVRCRHTQCTVNGHHVHGSEISGGFMVCNFHQHLLKDKI
jgi:hypothetical protein